MIGMSKKSQMAAMRYLAKKKPKKYQMGIKRLRSKIVYKLWLRDFRYTEMGKVELFFGNYNE